MNSKLKRNLIFIATIFSLILSVGVFNYSVDYYNVFHNKDKYIEIFDKSYKVIPAYLKRYSNIKNKTLMVSFSEGKTNFCDFNLNKQFFNSLFFKNLNCSFVYDCLKNYLDLHKETENVIFVFSYNIFFNGLPENNYVEDSQKNTLLYLLYSRDITKKNISIVRDDIAALFSRTGLHKKEKVDFQEDKEEYYPYFKMDFSADLSEVKKNTEINFQYLDKIFDLLDEKNIKYEVIIPPYNVIYLACLKKHNKYQTIEEAKKYLVNRVGVVYDFSCLNRLTQTNMINPPNYWFYINDHSNLNFGNKIFKFLFFRDYYTDNDLYTKLTKDNINKQLKKERNLLKDYMNKNKKYIEYYENLDVADEKPAYYDLSDLPEEIIEDEKFINTYRH